MEPNINNLVFYCSGKTHKHSQTSWYTIANWYSIAFGNSVNYSVSYSVTGILLLFCSLMYDSEVKCRKKVDTPRSIYRDFTVRFKNETIEKSAAHI